jgi:hypothetical protein
MYHVTEWNVGTSGLACLMSHVMLYIVTWLRCKALIGSRVTNFEFLITIVIVKMIKYYILLIFPSPTHIQIRVISIKIYIAELQSWSYYKLIKCVEILGAIFLGRKFVALEREQGAIGVIRLLSWRQQNFFGSSDRW